MLTRDAEKGIFKEIDRYYFLIACVGSFVLVVIYFVIDSWAAQKIRDLLNPLIVNLTTMLIAFAIVYAIFRRAQEIRSEAGKAELVEEIVNALRLSLPPYTKSALICYDVFDHIPWQQLFSNCARIDIVVHYFDTWINSNFSLLQDFFNRGGTVRLVIPNFKNTSLVHTIKQRFPESTEDQIVTKIRQTPDRFEKILQNSKRRDANLEVCHIDDMILYCGIRFDDRVLVLSMYEHVRELRVSNPGFVIPLDQYPQTREWFDKEFSGLLAK